MPRSKPPLPVDPAAPPPPQPQPQPPPTVEPEASDVQGDVRVEGFCDPAFSALEDAFAENLRRRDEVGGGVCVRIDGRVVVDLWGGHQDRARTRPWERDTLVNAYSVGKGLTAMLVLALVERGDLALDAPVSDGWPEFGAAGKAHTTLRCLLSHRAGLPGVREPLEADAMYDWTTMTRALASQAPYWVPDQDHGYHVNTFGFLVGEPVMRRTGLPFPVVLREQLCARSGAVLGGPPTDFFVGLPRSEHARVAPILEPAGRTITSPADGIREHLATGDPETDAMRSAVYFNPVGLSGFGCVNRPAWRAAAIPSTNGHATARAVAELYDLFLNRDVAQGGLVGPGLRSEARRTHADGIDRVLGKPSRFGLGFQLAQPTRPLGPSAASFGHFGYGGTLGFADPDSGVAFGYLMNRPGQRWHTPRTNALVAALNEALGADRPG